jgi:hypothetical protein
VYSVRNLLFQGERPPKVSAIPSMAVSSLPSAANLLHCHSGIW